MKKGFVVVLLILEALILIPSCQSEKGTLSFEVITSENVLLDLMCYGGGVDKHKALNDQGITNFTFEFSDTIFCNINSIELPPGLPINDAPKMKLPPTHIIVRNGLSSITLNEEDIHLNKNPYMGGYNFEIKLWPDGRITKTVSPK